ncbi:hypothetical protein RvY_04467 [Ramazzottius varieornatus]|uniref:Chitin-binding type-2 domain-containing protein n=1 Tax=Ramazzottius varieornatus TaxID=947166 RepID=A0A1D1USE2_RAMVA|nr:hypothetical protein RvY_04467 [Ramazzottius varieornatus]
MRLIGWGTEHGQDYWLIVNSWGTRWGMNGTVKFARGRNECKIEDYVVAGRALQGVPPKVNQIPPTTTTTTTTTSSSASTRRLTSPPISINPSATPSFPSVTSTAATTATAAINVSITRVAAPSTFTTTVATFTSTVATSTAATTSSPTTSQPPVVSSTSSSSPAGSPSTPPLLPGVPECYATCDAYFCSSKTNGYYQINECSRNYCKCSGGTAKWLSCAAGKLFEGNPPACKTPSPTWCPVKPPSNLVNTAPWPTAPANVSAVCNVKNCANRGPNGQSTSGPGKAWYTLGKCTPYWCFCTMERNNWLPVVLTCSAGQRFDFRSETYACVDMNVLPWCN